jgi:serine/threonine protein kinase
MPAPDDEGQEIGSYIIGRQIGVGGFSVVKEAIAIDNAKQVHAVKIVRKHATTDEWGNESLQTHFEHEINVWKCLSNRYILPLLSVVETSYATWAFTLLFTGGTLFDAFKDHRQGLPPMMALKYAYQLASALRYLHQDARVVHRDVKLENCILDAPMAEGGNLRLCDFGLADFLPGDDTPSPRQRYVTPHSVGESKQFIRPEDMVAGGSLAYAAPEQINSIVPLLDTAIDMWSYGVVVHALTVGELPFSDPFPPKLQMMITKGDWNIERFSGRVDSEVCEVVTSCLNMEHDHRWTAVDVLNSQWVSLYTETDV